MDLKFEEYRRSRNLISAYGKYAGGFSYLEVAGSFVEALGKPENVVEDREEYRYTWLAQIPPFQKKTYILVSFYKAKVQERNAFVLITGLCLDVKAMKTYLGRIARESGLLGIESTPPFPFDLVDEMIRVFEEG